MSNKKNQLNKYFGEIMREFFHLGTPKHYKVSISNPKSLLEELKKYIKSTQNDGFLQFSHLKYLIEEYLYRAERDIVFRNNNKNLSDFHIFLKEEIKNDIKKGKDLDSFVEKILNRVYPIIRNLEKNYFNQCQTYLLDILNKSEGEIRPGDFTLIKKVCYSFSTELIRNGYSRYYVYEKIEELLFGGISFEEKFIKSFDGKIKNYFLYVKILCNHCDVHKIFKSQYGDENVFIEDFPFFVQNTFSGKGENLLFGKYFSKNKNGQFSFWLKMKQAGCDYRSASNLVISSINLLLDEVKFEYAAENISIFNNVLSQDDLGNMNFIFTSDFTSSYRKNCSTNFFNSTNQKLKEIYKSDIIDDSTKEKIKTIFRFYRHFLEATTIEHRFLNLWVGWEHIFSLNFEKESQTWQNIQLYYPFIDSLLGIEGILKDMIQVQLNNGLNSSELEVFLSADTKYKATNLYKIIKDKTDDWDNFLKVDFIKDNDLLKVKLFRLHEKIKSPRQFVKNNKDKVQWNLYRLYRVRNAIVHKGSVCELGLPLEILIMDLESYYLNLLEIMVSRFSCNDRFENIEQLFTSYKRTYDLFQQQKGLGDINDTKHIKKRILNLSLVF